MVFTEFACVSAQVKKLSLTPLGMTVSLLLMLGHCIPISAFEHLLIVMIDLDVLKARGSTLFMYSDDRLASRRSCHGITSWMTATEGIGCNKGIELAGNNATFGLSLKICRGI